jgi:hypothetical protein
MTNIPAMNIFSILCCSDHYNLVEKIFSVLIYFFYSHSLLHRLSLGASELLLSEIMAVQEELPRFIMDHVVRPGAEFCIM